jgi:hypothetical protein
MQVTLVFLVMVYLLQEHTEVVAEMVDLVGVVQVVQETEVLLEQVFLVKEITEVLGIGLAVVTLEVAVAEVQEAQVMLELETVLVE